MKTVLLVATGAAVVYVADLAAQHGFGALVAGVAFVGVGVFLFVEYLTRPGVKRGRK